MPELESSQPKLWTVLRQDDSGNIFYVERRLPDQEAADEIAKEFNARDHKQFYWSRSYLDGEVLGDVWNWLPLDLLPKKNLLDI